MYDVLDVTPTNFAKFQWIPAHLDTQDKLDKYQDLINSSNITQDDIDGNVLADEYAAKGANMHNLPPEIKPQKVHAPRDVIPPFLGALPTLTLITPSMDYV